MRRYEPEDVRRLRFIRRAQAAGFTLEEIGELLALDRTGDRARVRELASERLAALDARIAELEASRAALERLRSSCAVGTQGALPDPGGVRYGWVPWAIAPRERRRGVPVRRRPLPGFGGSGGGDPVPLRLVSARERRHQRRLGGVRQCRVRMDLGPARELSSSPGIDWLFCADCGSLVGYRRGSRPDHMDITTGTLDDPDRFPPGVEIWVNQKIGWETLHPDLPKRKRRSSLNE